MGDAPGALGGAIPRDKTLRDYCVSFPKRTILSSVSVGIRAGDVTPSEAYLFSGKCIIDPNQTPSKQVKPVPQLYKILKCRLAPDVDIQYATAELTR